MFTLQHKFCDFSKNLSYSSISFLHSICCVAERCNDNSHCTFVKSLWTQVECQVDVTGSDFGRGSVLSAQSRYLSAGCILLGCGRRKQPWPGLFRPAQPPSCPGRVSSKSILAATHTHTAGLHKWVCTCTGINCFPKVCVRSWLKYINNFITTAVMEPYFYCVLPLSFWF